MPTAPEARSRTISRRSGTDVDSRELEPRHAPLGTAARKRRGHPASLQLRARFRVSQVPRHPLVHRRITWHRISSRPRAFRFDIAISLQRRILPIASRIVHRHQRGPFSRGRRQKCRTDRNARLEHGWFSARAPSHRQPNENGGSARWRTVYGDLAVVRFHESLDRRQTQAGSS